MVEPALATYGLARIAQKRGNNHSARELGQDALNALSRLRIKHRQYQEIADFLAGLDACAMEA